MNRTETAIRGEYQRWLYQLEPQFVAKRTAPALPGRTILQMTAHDLQRTLAKPARKEGATLDQIQLTLGHSNIRAMGQYPGEGRI